MKKLKIGITMGDMNGVGPEVIIKALDNPKILEMCTPIIYGSSKLISYHKNIVKTESFNFSSISDTDRASSHKINVLNCWNEDVSITLGKATEDGGKYAYIALDRALNDIKEHKIDALVTAPINKAAMNLANFPYPGHTEFLTDKLGNTESLMMMVADQLKIALVTNHLPVSKIAETLTRDLLIKKLKILNSTLIADFGIEKPSIAILGLNPHAGDNGVIGSEEEDFIRPVIIEAKKKGLLVMGPYAADGFFGSSTYRKVDAILAMYHDQGLIPFKSLSFGTGTNFTAGLSIIRTSPDHGTAYDIAGQSKANPSSMRSAIYQALDLARNRKAYIEDRENRMTVERKKAKASRKN